MSSLIYRGGVSHRRLGPVKHSFDYPLYFFGFNLDELPRDITSYLGQRAYTINRYIELTQNVLSQTEKVLEQLNNQG